jgi:hypothetical protein
MTDYPFKKTDEFRRTTYASSPIYYLGRMSPESGVTPEDLDGKGNPTPSISNQYCRAQRAIYAVQQSCLHFVLTEKSTPYRNVDLDGNPIAKGFKPEVHALLEEHQKQSLGDYWRVLRLRPATNSVKATNRDMEYVPNDTYSYYQVRKTLAQVARAQIKPCRYYWNELPAKEVPDDILYSLSEFWPGMPREADIVRDNVKLGLNHSRMYEQTSLPSETTMGGKERKLNDGNYTIAYLLKIGAIPNDEQASFEQYMTRIQEMDIKYATFIAQWPFLVAQRLLKMQSSRLRVIKGALAEKLNNHSLNTNNVTGFNNPNANPGINNGSNPLSADLTTALYRGGLHTLPASVTAGMNYVGDPAGFYNPNANTALASIFTISQGITTPKATICLQVSTWPCSKEEEQRINNPKVRFALVKSTSAAGANKSLTLPSGLAIFCKPLHS